MILGHFAIGPTYPTIPNIRQICLIEDCYKKTMLPCPPEKKAQVPFCTYTCLGLACTTSLRTLRELPIFECGLSSLTAALRTLHIDANLDFRQIPSPHLEQLIVEASLCMLDATQYWTPADAVHHLICSPDHPARAVSSICTPHKAQSREHNL